MAVIIHLPPEKEAALKTQAESLGMSVEEWLLDLAEQATGAKFPGNGRRGSFSDLQRTNPEEWGRRFHEWAAGHDRTTPLLDDEAINRRNIYPDRD
jgi:hypothetical protein